METKQKKLLRIIKKQEKIDLEIYYIKEYNIFKLDTTEKYIDYLYNVFNDNEDIDIDNPFMEYPFSIDYMQSVCVKILYYRLAIAYIEHTKYLLTEFEFGEDLSYFRFTDIYLYKMLKEVDKYEIVLFKERLEKKLMPKNTTKKIIKI